MRMSQCLVVALVTGAIILVLILCTGKINNKDNLTNLKQYEEFKPLLILTPDTVKLNKPPVSSNYIDYTDPGFKQKAENNYCNNLCKDSDSRFGVDFNCVKNCLPKTQTYQTHQALHTSQKCLDHCRRAVPLWDNKMYEQCKNSCIRRYPLDRNLVIPNFNP